MQRAIRGNPVRQSVVLRHIPSIETRAFTIAQLGPLQDSPWTLPAKSNAAPKTRNSHVAEWTVQTDGHKHHPGKVACVKWGNNTQVVVYTSSLDLGHFESFLKVLRGDGLDHVSGDKLWWAYLNFKTKAPDSLSQLSKLDWGSLFHKQLHIPLQDEVKARRLYQLHQDIMSAGVTSFSSRLCATEWCRKVGWDKRAFEVWETCAPLIHEKIKYIHLLNYYKLGAILHADLGQTTKAHELMEESYKYAHKFPMALLHYIFTAHIKSGDQEAAGRLAYSIFNKMQERCGKEMELGHYRFFINGFLTRGFVRHATNVFQSMVLHLAAEYDPRMREKVLGILKQICDKTKDFEDFSEVMLEALSALRKSYHPYIFQQWLQRTAIEHTPEAAAQIIELMFSKGFHPDVHHFNILLRVLARTGNKHHTLKCESIGWKMIMVAGDELDVNIPKFIRPLSSQGVIVNGDLNRVLGREMAIPPADSDTFAILLQLHTKAKQWEHVAFLIKKLDTAGVQRTSPLLNTLISAARWNGDYDGVFRQFNAWTKSSDVGKAVLPDGASWRALWATLRLAGIDNYKSTRLPSPRTLLYECVKWWNYIQSRRDLDPERFKIGLAGEDGKALQKLVMHCFNNAEDLPGQLISLHTLRKIFHLLPPKDTYQSLRFMIIKQGLLPSVQTSRSTYVHSRSFEMNVQRLDRVYHLLMRRRFDRMKLSADDYASLNEAEVSDLNLKIISDFVRVILVRQYRPEHVEAMIERAKRDIGVPDLDTGDGNALTVA